MTAFFIPGVVGDARSVEDAYGEMRSRIELELGSLPSARRIFRLWSRRSRVDCITEVGRSRSPSPASNSSEAAPASARRSGATPTRCSSSTDELQTLERDPHDG